MVFQEPRAKPEVNVLGLGGASGLTEELNGVLLGMFSEGSRSLPHTALLSLYCLSFVSAWCRGKPPDIWGSGLSEVKCFV